MLEDCRLMNESFPELKLISLETNEQTFKRQHFHKFSKSIQLKRSNLQNFMSSFKCNGREIIWLDYVDLKSQRFNEFSQLLVRADLGTIVKITLRAQLDRNPHSFSESREDEHDRKWEEFRERFENEFGCFMPGDESDDDYIPGEFPKLLQRMLQIAAQKALSAESGAVFQPLHSAYYNDGTLMLSLAGIVWDPGELNSITKHLVKWKFRNLDWQPPFHIDVPVLSTKERLLLERHLPLKDNTGKVLARALGYSIGDTGPDNLRRLQQYADFHRYYPYFGKLSV